MRAMIVILAMVASPAFAADQFDLICTAKKESERYRVDLSANKWCDRDCTFTQDIAEINERIIMFEKHEPQFERDKTHRVYANRLNGEWTKFDEFYIGRTSEIVVVDGKCEVAPFSGFPVLDRKF